MQMDAIDLIYWAALHRAPDAGGKDFYLGHLRAGTMTGPEVLAQIMASNEAQARAAQIDYTGTVTLPSPPPTPGPAPDLRPGAPLSQTVQPEMLLVHKGTGSRRTVVEVQANLVRLKDESGDVFPVPRGTLDTQYEIWRP
ncbi:MAG: DUF4214 domain-containing protein [Pseudomonadota bacterium]